MSFRSLLRILIYACVVMLVAVVLRLREAADSGSAESADEPEPTPAVRLAREDQPTIVEPNDGWLHHHHADSESGHLTDAHPPDLLPGDGTLDAQAPLSR